MSNQSSDRREAKAIKVCVVGAGVCGIVAIKECLGAGLDVTCFDRSPHYGGLWRYHDDRLSPGKFYPSVMRTTILNTSKELSAFSDFPPPGTLPNFMRHDQYMQYIDSYVDHFNIKPTLRLEHEVLRCEPELLEDGECRWHVEVKDLRDSSTSRQVFDKLLAAMGHHNIPRTVDLPDQDKFKGLIVHSYTVKDILTDERFIDKRVLVIGFGNSACDASTDLALITKKCYLSSHRGNWLYTRLAVDGAHDINTKNNFHMLKYQYLPVNIDKWVINRVERAVNHQMLGLKPEHKPRKRPPITNDMLPYRVFTGGVILKNDLVRLTEDGAIFKGEEDEEHKLDAVILCTGYHEKATFLDECGLGIKSDKKYELYMNVFPSRLRLTGFKEAPMKAVKSLAYIGMSLGGGSVTVYSELQSRWVSQVFAGKVELPSKETMQANINRKRAKKAKSSKDLLVASWTNYLNELGALLGVKPNLSKLLFKDFTLWKALMFGPHVPYQYRLGGPGKWDQARATILTVPKRFHEGINEGKNHILFKERRKYLKEH